MAIIELLGFISLQSVGVSLAIKQAILQRPCSAQSKTFGFLVI